MCQECQPALIAEIRSHGVTEYDIEPHGSHRTLLFTYNGRSVRLVFGTNPSDRRHLQNALSDLRRAMEVKRVIVKHRAPKPTMPARSRRAAAPLPLPTLTAPPPADPWAPLRALAERRPTALATPAPGAIRLRCPQFGRRSRWQEAP